MKLDGAPRFTAAEVTRITGVPYQTLNSWVRIGLASPSICDAQGSGTRRVYDMADLVVINAALKLRRAGIQGKALVRILDELRRAGTKSPAAVGMRITDSGEVIVSPKKGEAFSARRHPGQMFLDFDFDGRRAADEIRHLLKEDDAKRSLSSNDKPATKGRRTPAGADRCVCSAERCPL